MHIKEILSATREQTCYNLFAGLLQLVTTCLQSDKLSAVLIGDFL